MKILITGVHGYVGSNLVEALKDDHIIYGLDIFSQKNDGIENTFHWIALDDLTGMELDPEQLAEVFPEGTLFRADTEFRAGDHYVLLSTCSYEYNGARFIVLGRLIDLNGEAQ